MFNLRSNPAQEEIRPTPKGSRISAGVLAASVLGAGLAGTLGTGVAYADTSNSTATGQAAASPVHGSGTTDDPFIGPCDDPKQVDCTVSSFAARGLNGGQSEWTKAYKCPTDHPYLVFGNWAPAGSTWVQGEEFTDRGSINIYTVDTQSVDSPKGPRMAGTRNGFLDGSATNWSLYSHTYQPVLHCTSDPDHGYY